MFSIATVASSTRMPMASARPPSVMMLIVCPVSHSPTSAGEQRKRDGRHDDQRAAPIAQEEQHHQSCQDCAERALEDQPADCVLDVG